ncbi:MAG: hypothetical protein FJ008_02700 [Chloroflexi bacterium]|nr:hypothetical protein [Chloroflexota bacterium]MBM3154223.1 hypothetical protein [Chloroflexota bacterium]MBM3172330.1 hypothetical protein [Chloroflexota bacterium]MBM3175041.1 hypothetical protein [Chloroflexota bacterium]MBM4449912.1 hypothetical protein [Chloroflexota bacterium]
MDILQQMKQFLEPQSVALVGLTRRTGEDSFNVMENLLSYGYQGKMFPINPSTSEILGIKTYPRVTEIPEPVDLAIIATPRNLVPHLLHECSQKGIRSAVVFAQGFADAIDDEGKQLHHQMLNVIENNGIRIVGPNTFGTANAFINFSSSFFRQKLKKWPIGVICQSGMFYIGFPELTMTGKGIDLGNACDIGFVEGLQYFEDDPQTRVIALHIEGMKDPANFTRIARKVARKKPLVALKTGRNEQAARAAESHTGSLTGRDEIWDTALNQAGVIRVSDLQELVDITRAFTVLPPLENPNVAVASLSGALGIMTLDACTNTALKLGKLSPRTQKGIESISPPWLKIGNPIDIWPVMMSSPNVFTPLIDSLNTLLSDPQLGAVIFIGAAFDEKWATGLPQFLTDLAVRHPDKPFACCIYGPNGDDAIKGLQEAGKIAAYPTPERAIRALARIYEYSQLRSRL